MSYIADKIKSSTQDAIELERECKKLQREIDDKLEVIKEIRHFIFVHRGNCAIKELKDPEIARYVSTIFRSEDLTITTPILTLGTGKNLTALNAGKDKFFKEYRKRQAIAKENGLTLNWPEYLQDRKNEKIS